MDCKIVNKNEKKRLTLRQLTSGEVFVFANSHPTTREPFMKTTGPGSCVRLTTGEQQNPNVDERVIRLKQLTPFEFEIEE